jgi:hypothetical protein
MDLRRLRAGEWMVGAAGLTLLVALFLPWYGPEDATAWEAFSVVDVLLGALALAAVTLPVVVAHQRTPAMGIAYEGLLGLAAILGLLILVVRTLNLPDGADSRELGVWLGLAAGLALTLGCMVAMRDERLSRPGEWTDSTGAPIAAPPEIETLPAPEPGAPRP